MPVPNPERSPGAAKDANGRVQLVATKNRHSVVAGVCYKDHTGKREDMVIPDQGTIQLAIRTNT